MHLQHSGRLGQKWGVRNGPPYPLNRSTVSKVYGKNPVTRKISKKTSKTNDGDIKTTWSIKSRKGEVKSELSIYDFGIKDFDWKLLADVETNKKYRGQGLANQLVD